MRTSILTAQPTPAPQPTRRVTPQTRRSQPYLNDFAAALDPPRPALRRFSATHFGHRFTQLRFSLGMNSRVQIEQAAAIPCVQTAPLP